MVDEAEHLRSLRCCLARFPGKTAAWLGGWAGVVGHWAALSTGTRIRKDSRVLFLVFVIL